MHSYPNIERFAHKPAGVYTGYGGGAVWSITGGRGGYLAIPRQSDAPPAVRELRLRAPTLAKLSEQLSTLDTAPVKRNPAKKKRVSVAALVKDFQWGPGAPRPKKKPVTATALNAFYRFTVAPKDKESRATVSRCENLADAKRVAKALADYHGIPYTITSKK